MNKMFVWIMLLIKGLFNNAKEKESLVKPKVNEVKIKEGAMEILVDRKILTTKSSIGELLVDGKFQCYTLEDRVRELSDTPVSKWKQYGTTAIPQGRYKLIVNMSNRFKKQMPLLLDVEGFRGIRIHSGNIPKHTLGCILVGNKKGSDKILDSRNAYKDLMVILNAAIKKGDEIYITVQ